MKPFIGPLDIDKNDFASLCGRQTDPNRYPHATELIGQVVVYHRSVIVETPFPQIRTELVEALKDGPGVIVIRDAFDDRSVIEQCNDIFARIVRQESQGRSHQGDHFGNNQRIWNAFQKLAVTDPELFVTYYGNRVLQIISEAWLGPGYRLTAQMNNIRPGGAAQSPHRDFHLGFQSEAVIERFPTHAQVMSQFLTLQGAIAHVDMPIESGSTQLLPFSQQCAVGYLASARGDFERYFAEHHVQLPLAKGDALFFNPALFHAGGTNRTGNDRIANLLQVSSALGRTMETIDHRAVIEAVYPILRKTPSSEITDNVIAAIADGYAFPTNLDSDPPIDGLAPKTQQHWVRLALVEQWSLERLNAQLDAYDERRRAKIG